MEEFDSHTEHAQDQAHEAAHESRERWITGVALTAAVLAALAAITSMLSGHHEHESMMEQMKATDQWNEYQAHSIKTIVREQQIENLKAAGEKVPDALSKKVDEAHRKEAGFRRSAGEMQDSSAFHDKLHMIFGASVTLFQVAIAVSAISALTRRREFWHVGIALGALALGALVAGLLYGGGIVGHHAEESKASAMGSPVGAYAVILPYSNFL